MIYLKLASGNYSGKRDVNEAYNGKLSSLIESIQLDYI